MRAKQSIIMEIVQEKVNLRFHKKLSCVPDYRKYSRPEMMKVRTNVTILQTVACGEKRRDQRQLPGLGLE